MMNTAVSYMGDKAIEYNSKLYKLKGILDKMQDIGLNTQKYRNMLNTIEENLASAKNKSDNSILLDSMEQDLLNSAYTKAINSLDNLLHNMKAYEIYLKAASFCGVLNNFITNGNINNLPDMRIKIIEMLNGIRNSRTLDYDVEGSLVEDIYSLAYEFIKIEIKELGTSVVLDRIVENEVDNNTLERAIVNELEHLDLKKERYKPVVNKKQEIEMLGFNASLVDINFIRTIVNCTSSYEENAKKADELKQKLESFYNKAIELERSIEYEQSLYSRHETNKKRNLRDECKKLIKNGTATFASLAVFVGLTIGTIKLSKAISTETKYNTTTRTYCTNEDVIESKEYKSSASETKTFISYTPYSKTSDGFSRFVTTYDITSLENLTLEELIELDFKSLGIDAHTDAENKEELTLKDLYDETIYVLREVSVDKEDYIRETDGFGFGIFALLIGLLAFLIDLLAEILLAIPFHFDEAVYDDFAINIISSITDIIDALKEIIDMNEPSKKSKKKIKDLINQTLKLLEDNEELIMKASEYLENSQDEKEKAQIEEKLTRIRTIKNKITKA